MPTIRRLFPGSALRAVGVAHILFLPLPLSLGAQVAPGGFQTGYSVSTWPESVEGMPSSPWELARTGDGLLWIATEEGLVRFDGFQFELLDQERISELSDDYIRAVEVEADTVLWLGTQEDGVIRLVGGRATGAWSTEEGLPSPSTYSLAVDQEGTVWVGTAEGLGRIEADTVRMDPGLDALPGRFVEVLEADPSGGVWVGTRDGGVFHTVRGGALEVTRLPGGEGLDVRALEQAPDGTLWIGAATGLFRFPVTGSGVVEAYPDFQRVAGDVGVDDLAVDGVGTLWAATETAGLVRIDEGGVRRLTVADGLPDDDPLALLAEPAGGVWVATRGRGLARIHPAPIRGVTVRDGLAAPTTLPILQRASGEIWVSSFGAGVTRFRADGVDTLTSADGLPDDVVLSLAEDPVDGMWIGTRTGVAHRTDDGTIRAYDTDDGLPHSAVLSILPLDGGRTIVGTAVGLAVIVEERTGGQVQGRVEPPPGGARVSVPVFGLFQASDGSVWIATNGQGAFHLRDGVMEGYAEDGGLGSDIVFDFYEEADGTLWIATQSAGLVRLRDGTLRAVGREAGLFDDQMFRILHDGSGTLWMCGNRGAFAASLDELHAVADGRSSSLSSPHFGADWGLPDSECNGGVTPAGWRMDSGQIWFPTMAGVAAIDPERTLSEYEAPLTPSVTSIRATAPDGTVAEVREALPAGARRLTFAYTAPTFVGASDLEFGLRLTPYDRTWVPGEPDRTVDYTNLPPGEHTLLLRVRRPGGAWSEPQVGARLELPPLWHQTLIFRGTVGMAAVLFLFGLHRLRVRRLRKREAELLAVVRQREEAEAKYRELFENATDVALTLDPRGAVTAVNTEAERALDRERDDLVGRTVGEFLHEDDRAALDHEIRELEAVGEGRRELQLRAVRPDGEEVVLDLRLRPIRSDGRVEGVQVMARDVTEKLELERQLLQSQKMEAVGSLTGGIAHDFNNLLTAIQGFAGLAGETVGEGSPARSDLREIEAAAERATALSRRLLTFGRSRPSAVERVDLNEVVRRSAGLLGRIIGAHIELVTDLDAAELPVAMDPVQAEQVLLNLVVNARDAMPDGGSITITTRRDGEPLGGAGSERGTAVVEVRDTGAGIEPDHLSHIFEPFFTTKGPDEGTGLGLSTVDGIVRECGGEASVDSEVGRGTTFILRFPLQVGAPEPERDPEPSVPGADRSTEATVFVVEDDPAIRTVVRRMLKRAGFGVILAGRVDEAERMWKERGGSVDVLLVDDNLPDGSGRAFATGVRAARADLPVVVMSGYAEVDLDSWSAPGPLPIRLTKPFTADRLWSVLDSQVGVGVGRDAPS